MEPNSQRKQILQMKTLLKNRNIDTKKLREGIAELARQKILDASMRLFASDGYQNRTPSSLAGLCRRSSHIGTKKRGLPEPTDDQKRELLSRRKI